MGPNFLFNAFENCTAMLNLKYVKYENFIQMKLLVVVFYFNFSLLSRVAE